jgi:hypothetical protein
MKEGGEPEEIKVEEQSPPVDNMAYPNYGWFLKWREGLILPNIKVCI